MKKSTAISILLSFFMVTQALALPVLAADTDMSVTQGCHSLDAAIPFLGNEQRVSNCTAALVYEVNTSTLMYAYNADAQVYPASLVKIMTAIIALEQGDPADIVAVDEAVLNTVPIDAVSSDLLPEEVMTLRDLLYCMMVDSGNDAAAVLADHVAGSQDAFVVRMNQLAQELGCTGTNFTNVHGLHDEQQYTTARDVARILDYAIKNEQFYELFCTINHTVPATNKSAARFLITGNYLISNENKDSVQIYYDGRVTGGRTGVDDNNRRCIASTAEEGNLKLITVVMGSKSQYKPDGYTVTVYGGYNETSSLLNACFDGLTAAQILYADQAIKQYQVLGGNSDVVVGPMISVHTVLPDGITSDQLTYRYSAGSDFKAPIDAGQVLSSLEVWYNNLCVAQADLYAMNSVSSIEDGAKEHQRSADDNSVLIIILLSVVAVAVVAVLTFFGVRFVRSAAFNNRSRRRRLSRRRSR